MSKSHTKTKTLSAIVKRADEVTERRRAVNDGRKQKQVFDKLRSAWEILVWSQVDARILINIQAYLHTYIHI